ncbi:tetratricopeptide repeat protein [Thermodesulfobacteriota bacterium]
MRQLLLILFSALLFSTLLSSCGSTEEKKERHFQKALEYIEQQDSQSAIIELRNAIKLDATYANAHYQLGLLYLKQGDGRAAFAELQRTADLDPDNLDASLKVAEFYLLGGNTEESRTYAEKVLSKDPNHLDTLYLLANLELIEGNFEAAHSALGLIGDQAQLSTRLLNIRGRIYAAEEKWQEAESAFMKALEIEPGNINNYPPLLMVYQNQEKTEQIRNLLVDLNERLPDNTEALLLLARFYSSQKDFERVEETLQKMVLAAPEQEEYRIILADHYQNSGQPKLAEEAMLQAQKELESSTAVDIKLASLYFDSQRFDESHSLLDKVVAVQADNNEARLLQARFLMKERKLRDSIELFKKLNEDFPKWADPYYYLGLAHLGLGEPELAALEVSRAIEANRNNNRYHTLMAHIHLTQGEFENAGNEAAIALQLNRKNLPAAMILGQALIGSKKFDQALKLYQDLNSQLPDNLDTLYGLALANLGMQRPEEAIAALENLLDRAPDQIRAVTLLIRLTGGGDLDKAESFVRSQLEKVPDSSNLYLLLGDIQVRRDELDQALRSVQTALEKNPENSQASIFAGRLLARLGRNEEARAAFAEMIERQPDSVIARMGIGAVELTEGDTAGAMAAYREILDIKDDYAPAANNLAWLIADAPDGDLGEALRLAMLAKQAQPDDPDISDTLGWVHYRRGTHTLAVPQFELALVGRPGDPTISYHLALALQGDGQTEKAREVLTDALAKGEEFDDREKAEELLRELDEASAVKN